MILVNTNISSLTAQRSLSNLSTPLNQTFQRLASGYRINSAADDAAGLQISSRLTSQINGLNQGVRNAYDGISLAQVAEGALDEMTNAVQRMRTLVIQSRSGINSQADRTALQNEIKQINKEITRIAETTNFAGVPLLDGTLNRDFLVGANAGENINVNLERDEGWTAEGLRLSEIVVDGSDGVNQPTQNGVPVTPGYLAQFPVPAILGTISGLEVRINGNEFRPVPDVVFSSTDPGVNAFNFALALQSTDISLVVVQADNLALGDQLIFFSDIEFRISGVAADEATAQANRAFISSLTGIPGAFFGEQAYNLFPPEDEDSITQFNLEIIDEAINTIDGARAKLGATQNRFQATIRNLSNINENVSAARSRIRDTDYAKETAELTRLQILQQASTTVLSQANQRPQAALTLLQ